MNFAVVVQWLERFLAKEEVAGSNPVYRSFLSLDLLIEIMGIIVEICKDSMRCLFLTPVLNVSIV